MMNINKNFLNLEQSYLFANIAKKVNSFRAANPAADIIRLGIGDVTLPLVPAVIDALHKATDEMSEKATFKGYGDYEGYEFLRAAVAGYYAGKGVSIGESEVFISDGSKSDVGNILDIFGSDNLVLIPDPVYPVYVDTNIMAGRRVVFINGTEENEFLPLPDSAVKADIIYLCSPNNPSGAVYDREQLKVWVDYANENGAVILFDAAYEKFIKDTNLPTSIFEIEGAMDCAIEFCSLSKTAGFTGTRCGYTVIPKQLVRQGESLHRLWYRRQTTKFNGVPYIVQRGAEAVFSDAGLAQVSANIAYYQENARILCETFRDLGIWFVGGENSPYVWMKTPGGMTSWEYFDYLLNNANVVGTPGAGFGRNGEGFFRLTAFGDRENVIRATERIKNL